MASKIATPPGLVVLVCEECDWRVDGGNDGYLCVDAHAASQRIANRNRQGLAADRYGVPGGNGHGNTADRYGVVDAPIAWHIYHGQCDPITDASGRYYVRDIQTSADLLAATAQMLRLPWIGETNLPGTLRRVLADTAGQAGMARHRPERLNR